MNFNTNRGWVRGYSITATNQPASLRWQGNDPYVNPPSVGESDGVVRVPGYTPGGSLLGNSSWIDGGYYVSSGVVPGTNYVRNWKSFTSPVTLSSPTAIFSVEWSLVGSLDSSYPKADRFSFDLRNTANSASLLTLVMTQGINIVGNAYTLQTVTGTNAPVTRIDLGYQAVYQIAVAMTGSTYDLSLSQINPSTRAVITNYSLITGASLTTGYSANDFGTVSAGWQLASGNPNDPGSNYMIVNDVSVVPEPSTWSLLAMTAVIAGAFVVRRRV